MVVKLTTHSAEMRLLVMAFLSSVSRLRTKIPELHNQCVLMGDIVHMQKQRVLKDAHHRAELVFWLEPETYLLEKYPTVTESM